MELKEKILKLKFHHNKTTNEIVDEAKVNIYDYESLEIGVGTPDNETLMKIANYYGISTVELVDPYSDINDLLNKSHICIAKDNKEYTRNDVDHNDYYNNTRNNIVDNRPPMQGNTSQEGSIFIGILITVFLGFVGLLIALLMGKPKTIKGALIGFIVSFILQFILIYILKLLGIEIPEVVAQ